MNDPKNKLGPYEYSNNRNKRYDNHNDSNQSEDFNTNVPKVKKKLKILEEIDYWLEKKEGK